MKIPCTLRFVPSLLLGLCFLFSGGLKGIDPYGTSLKLEEYFRVWGWDGFVADHALVWAVWLCAGELCLGLWLLLGVFRRLSAWLSLAAMAAFCRVEFAIPRYGVSGFSIRKIYIFSYNSA